METKHLTRSQSDRMLGGVCGGLGHYFGIDATIVRLLFVLLTVGAGSGVLLYFVLWIVMPREDLATQQTNLDGDELGRRARQMGEEVRQVVAQPNPRSIQFLGIALVVLGLIYLVQNLNIPWLSWFNNALAWPLVIIMIGVILLTRAFRK